MSTITHVDTTDIRFPTSQHLDGSDAMNPDPDYSAAYVRIVTDADDGIEGHGFVFTIGRGNDIETTAIRALAPFLVGREVEPILDRLGDFWRELVGDSQLHWLGPEKGVMHMAIGAVVKAMWDIKAKRAGLPLWQLLGRMSPEEIVDLIDFRYLTDALTREEALTLLRAAEPGRADREAELLRDGYPAYTTTPGWLGYSDEKLVRLCREAVDDGFRMIKLKVGADVEDDVRRMRLARETVGPDILIGTDANQRWDVDEAIAWMDRLAEFDVAWIEEPTNPDDILAHAAIAKGVAPIPVATGEHCGGRVMFKQMLQAGSLSVLQIDASRVAGVNENIAILLLAAKFGVPVCPHAGGVGLCEAVQ
ncbi:MAG TPA: enolase C-terminal domain-like protein, partial [Microbacterium sp.]|nr:enolase C-terminal domain-like protein [Microbacterium sp.]